MRYKVCYGADKKQDYAVVYGQDEVSARAMFSVYNPDKEIIKVEEYIDLTDIASKSDKDKFIRDLIEFIQHQELESTCIEMLTEQYGYTT